MTRALCMLLALAACSRTTGVRIQLALEDGAPPPEAIDVSIYDRFGGIAYGLELAPRLPGDLLVLVGSDADFVRVFGRGTTSGQMIVAGVAATTVEMGRELALPLTLSTSLPSDRDGDSVPDAIDVCPDDFDPEQAGDTACTAVAITAPDLGGTPAKPDLAPTPNGAADLAGAPDPTPSPAVCGDGIVQAGEACDEGGANSDLPSAASGCTSGCRLRAGCGSLAGSNGVQVDVATGHCYVAWPNLVSWALASRACQAHGGHLATVTSAAENARIQTLSGASDRWIGLKIDHAQAVRDHWVNGETVNYGNYAATEPNNGGTNGDPEACAVFDAMRGAWDDRPCGLIETGALPYSYTYATGYICENECGNGVVDPGEECEPSGGNCTSTCRSLRACNEPGAVSSPVTGHCYFTTATPVAFNDAMTACPAGTHLATLDEIAESEAGALAIGASEAWIALKANVQGSYAWTVGTDYFDSRRYHGFQGSEPNDTGGAPYCARITPLGGWKDRVCTSLYVGLCERE